MCAEVFVEVLRSDGGVFTATVLGASLALVDAGIPMRNVVCAGTAVVIKSETTTTPNTDTTWDGDATLMATAQQKIISHHVIADPTEEEI